MDNAEKAVVKAYSELEKKQSAHKESLQNESDKHVVFQLWSVMRIAKFAFKIKRTELKLAKSDYKFAKKAAKKAGQKANKESVVAETHASKPVEKKKKAAKKPASA
ncbi:MAG: hypothetical protein IT262_15500 [Saprospiraceae bacterium]|nr:hypothetical protein [Saprospiraceae bacterium]